MAGALYCVGLVLVSGVLLLVLNRETPWLSSSDVRAELVKVGIQVVVFGLVGGGVKLLLDRQAEYRRFRSDILERLGRAHKDVYRIRRLLPTSNSDEVRELLGELMNARQDLGAASHAMRIWGLGVKVQDVQRETAGMRLYLEAVIHGALAPAEAPERKAYTDFLSWQTEGTYESEFKRRYLLAKRLVDPDFAVGK